MIKDVSALTNTELDYLVGKAMGYNVEITCAGTVYRHVEETITDDAHIVWYHPTEKWKDLDEVIELYGMSLIKYYNDALDEVSWCSVTLNEDLEVFAETPHLAVCRCCVKQIFGDEFDVDQL